MGSFYETVFVKKDSSLEAKLDSLKSSMSKDEIHMLEAGIAGEKQVAYHLNKSNIGMYVMRDVNLEYGDLKAQIDFVVVTSHHCYFIECKNYNSDIIRVDDFGNFETSTKYGRKYNKMGIKSPISQVEDQLTVFKKICLNNQDEVINLLDGVKFKDYFKSLVVFTNPENRLDLKNAPSDIKYRVLKVDNLIRQIEYDDKHFDGNRFSKEQVRDITRFILSNNVDVKVEDIPKINHVKDESTSNKNGSKTRRKKKSILYDFGRVILVILVLASFAGLVKYNNSKKKNIEDNGNYPVLMTEDQSKALSIFKSAYNDSKANGFTVIHTSVCYEISKIFNNGNVCTNCCISMPIEVNFVSDKQVTFYKKSTNSCSTLNISSDGKSIESISNETKICNGQPIGMVEWDDSNEFYQKIGGYDKIRKMAIFAYRNNSGFSEMYYDQSHIVERNGNVSLYSTYTQNVNMFFAGVTGKGSLKSDTTKNYFNKMVESYYYVMK